jgi:KUP system potassium uptake protein
MAAVFLAVTGAEALYADMGHFGRGPIRIAWTGLVLPSLALAYLGQGALVLAHPDSAENPFFLMAPSWGLLPLVLLATAATVIASQAVITGAFSMAHQAVQLGLLPRIRSFHTSESEIGQFYLPRVNWFLLLGVVMLVIAFESSTNLASAYGIAVTGNMITTSILAALVFRLKWRWPLALVAIAIVPMLGVELLFLAANLTKVLDGGYVTIVVAALLSLVMWTWVRGVKLVRAKTRGQGVRLDALCGSLEGSPHIARVPGTAVFLTSDPDMPPSALLHNLKHNAVLHEQNVVLTVHVSTRPRVPDEERVRIARLTDDFTRVDLTFGYLEPPNVPRALVLARKAGLHFDIMTTSFFLHRRFYREATNPPIPRWQEKLFLSLARGAAGARSYYRLPSDRVIELGQQVTI